MSQTPIFPLAAAKLGAERDRQIAEAAWRAGVEAAAKVADSFTCGGCGMDGKSSAAIRALQPPPDLGDAP